MGLRRSLPLVLATLAACSSPTGPTPPLTRLTAADHTFFPIAPGEVHALEVPTREGPIACESCHPASTESFTDIACLGCHQHERPVTDRLHSSVPDYGYTSAACYSCHERGRKLIPYDHAGITGECAMCHDVERPYAALPVAGLTHPSMNGSDCGACHVTTSWKGASGAPPALTADPNRDVTVASLIPRYAGTSIAALSPQTQVLRMTMNHASAQVPAALACADCHAGGALYPGDFHSSLANFDGGQGLPQPAACGDCHREAPVGFVGPLATSPARTPPSGEMKHDAVLWSAGAPTATRVPQGDCAACHAPPSRRVAATWATGRDGAPRARFHAALADAGVAQPGSCVDCHANSRPEATLTALNAAVPAGLEFDHRTTAARADCGACHAGSAPSYAAWTGGRYHLPGASTPPTCLPCHAGARPTSTTGWQQADYRDRPFDYGTNAEGIPHGGGEDCAVCHRGPGTGGAWGGRQSWQGGHFPHGPGTIATRTCIACHMSQRPDLLPGTTPAAVATLLTFDHVTQGEGECFGCHQASVTAGSYRSYFNPATGTLPGGDWKGGLGYPGSSFVSGSGAFITVTQTTLHRSGAYHLVTSTSSASATLYNGMLHDSPAVPSALNAGPTGAPDHTKCWHCHTHTAGVVTDYRNGRYHQALDQYSSTPGGAVSPLPQPTARCVDCHAQMLPQDIVMKAGSTLQPMDHAARFTQAVPLGGKSVTSVAEADCSVCHRTAAGTRWDDGVFHANVGAAVPQDCVSCHYPLLADAARADVASGAAFAMKHRSTQLTTQACEDCHPTALAQAATPPATAARWRTGVLHPAVATQPTRCLDCHAASEPTTATQSTVTYALAQGATATNGGQWMSHASLAVVGQDCGACHAADARPAGSAWSRSTVLHTAPVATCTECHGPGNGNGAAPGTRNNLPAGLTDSSTLTTASAATGVPAGTRDQLTHADPNVTGHDCDLCHTQAGAAGAPPAQGREWAQARFHQSFSPGSPLQHNGTTARCSTCHLNVKPGPTYAAFDHAAFTATSPQDCGSCHAFPGTGTASAPNWLGAAGLPTTISVGGFLVPRPPAPTSTTTQAGIANLPHPPVASGVACTTCHGAASGGRRAFGYDHASTLITARCNACHEAGSDLVGTPWNGATTQSAGAGDTRPFTLTAITTSYKGNTSTFPNTGHFYPVDCAQCHVVPTGNGFVTTGTAYKTAWRFPHTESRMTNPATCLLCHVNGAPD